MEEYEFDITLYVKGNIKDCYSRRDARDRMMDRIHWAIEDFSDSLIGRIYEYGDSLYLSEPVEEPTGDTQQFQVLENNIWGYP